MTKRSSKDDGLQPMLAAIAKTAARICEANDAAIFLVEGDQMRLVARYGRLRTAIGRLGDLFPLTLDFVAHRAIRERRTIHVRDLAKVPRNRFLASKESHLPLGVRTMLSTPLLRQGVSFGVIAIRRTKVRPFTSKQIALLKTFADQAVIAIENVRLFAELGASNRDLTEALQQQTATSEILRVISSSPTDIQPVLEAVSESAERLCEADLASVFRFDGTLIHHAAQHGRTSEEIESARQAFPRAPHRGSVTGRAILAAGAVQIGDVAEDPEADDDLRVFRTVLSVPMIRDGQPLGAITVARRVVRPFTDGQIALLRTFAEQAVIAIENVRLFTELQARNRDLTEALEQQTATSQVLRVISSSPTEIQPVLDTVAESAARLCEAQDASIFRRDDERLLLVAHHGPIPFGPIGQTSLALIRGTANGRSVLDARTIHVADLQTEVDEFPEGSETARRFGHRTTLNVPLLREGVAIGSISIRRTEAALFSDRQVALLQTFAHQAVIAIENVRLFKELEARNRDLAEALEQQTATSEILRVISQSPTDIEPVLDALVKSATRFCGAYDAVIFLPDGDNLRIRAHHGPIHNPVGRVVPLVRGTVGGRVLLERRAIHVADLQAETEEFPEGCALARELGHRTTLGVPLVRESAAIGVIQLRRAEVNPFSEKQIALLRTFADQAVIAIENVRLFKELQQKNEALTVAHAQVSEALEQQTATSEILRVISSSPTDVQPVFEAIVESASRLCDAAYSAVARFEDGLLHLAAVSNMSPEETTAYQSIFPRTPGRHFVMGRAFVEGRPVHVEDIDADPDYDPRTRQVLQGAAPYRTFLGIPILRDGVPIGAIGCGRREVKPFTAAQIELVKTFADQAVIAIENVRLFKELEARNSELTEALEQQTATSKILQVISSSPTDLQPIFDIIAESAVKLCGAEVGLVTRVEGGWVDVKAVYGTSPAGLDAIRRVYPMRPSGAAAGARAIRDCAIAHIPDVLSEEGYAVQDSAVVAGFRAALGVPMMREGRAIGSIAIGRAAPGDFSEAQIKLLCTFADQALIAIENVRLFKELEARNKDLTVALEQQTATSEILRVISQSPTDVQPVFDTIVRSAVRLCDGLFSGVFQFDGELLHFVTGHNFTPEALEAQHRIFPARPNRDRGATRAILECAVVHIPDVERDPEYRHQVVARTIGFRSGLFVPMLRDGAPIGVIMVTRPAPGPFSDNEIELLKTFADQAVIAVENVRLFKELQARTGELTESVEKLTALGEVSQALSSTLDVETVLDTIVSHASQLAGGAGCAIYEYDEAAEQFELRATHGYDTEFVEALGASPLRKGEGLMGRAAEVREAMQVPDITQPRAYQSSVRDTLIRFGYRALLSVPLLREEQIIGSLSLTRRAPGEYSPEVIEVLKTFATQSALAIQNARLFREIADKSRQLEVASRHKSEFMANMSHELRTPLNAIIGFSEVLNERMFGELNEKQEEYLKDIHASGQHLLSLINDILDLSKVEAGRMELELTDFDLPAAMDNAVTLVRERASRKGITARIVAGKLVGMIRADERKIRQVLLNLLSNAIKFTPEGGRIEVGAVMDDGAVEVSVTDTGVGIAPEDHEAVFEEFRQVGASAAKQEGTGLGLALCRKFIELHGGTIRVKSAIGAGSTFTFRLPTG